MNYAYTENGQVVEGPKELPKSWKNISGLDLMNDTELKAVGWLPVVDVNKDYNPIIQTQSGPDYTVQEDDVLATYTNTDKPLEDVKTRQINMFRNEASNEIESTQPAYRQRNAALGIYDQTEIDAIKTDIETVRTKFHTKEDEVNACTTNAEVIAITW